jgi:hypothetical protein
MTHEPSKPTLTPDDAAIDSMFSRRARRVDPDGLRDQILAATAVVSQTRGWRIRLQAFRNPPRALVLALLATGLVGMAILGSGTLREPPPGTRIAETFIRPFEYALLPDETMRLATLQRALVAWTSGPDFAAPDPVSSPEEDRPIWQPMSAAGGIIVASAETAWSHSPSSRFTLRTAPGEFIADLRDTARVEMGEVAETTLDGRPALTVMLSGIGGFDIHVAGDPARSPGPFNGLGGPGGDAVLLNVPARLIAADIDGSTVFVLVWAHTTEDLDAWLPVADKFVSTIQFKEGSKP